MKFYVKTPISIIIAALCCLSAYGQGDWKKETGRALAKITSEKLNEDILFLTDSICNGRATGTRGNIEAAYWIKRRFRNAGLLCMNNGYGSHFVTPNGTVAHNIIGMIPGAISIPRDRYVIIGAHFDHLGQLNGQVYPGADANASGTVALTALADIFGEMKEQGKVYDSNILFIAFDAKEMGMAGSDALWKLIEYGLLKDPISGKSIKKDQIGLMINIDQLGSTLSPIRRDRKDYMLMLGNSSLPKDGRMDIETCNMMSGINLDLCLSYYGSKTFTDVFYRLSDQKVFVDNKIPAVLFTSGITMNTNKTRDTAASLDMDILLKRILLIYYWTEQML